MTQMSLEKVKIFRSYERAMNIRDASPLSYEFYDNHEEQYSQELRRCCRANDWPRFRKATRHYLKELRADVARRQSLEDQSRAESQK